jgi:hypothetical protein
MAMHEERAARLEDLIASHKALLLFRDCQLAKNVTHRAETDTLMKAPEFRTEAKKWDALEKERDALKVEKDALKVERDALRVEKDILINEAAEKDVRIAGVGRLLESLTSSYATLLPKSLNESSRQSQASGTPLPCNGCRDDLDEVDDTDGRTESSAGEEPEHEQPLLAELCSVQMERDSLEKERDVLLRENLRLKEDFNLVCIDLGNWKKKYMSENDISSASMSNQGVAEEALRNKITSLNTRILELEKHSTNIIGVLESLEESEEFAWARAGRSMTKELFWSKVLNRRGDIRSKLAVKPGLETVEELSAAIASLKTFHYGYAYSQVYITDYDVDNPLFIDLMVNLCKLLDVRYCVRRKDPKDNQKQVLRDTKYYGDGLTMIGEDGVVGDRKEPLEEKNAKKDGWLMTAKDAVVEPWLRCWRDGYYIRKTGFVG